MNLAPNNNLNNKINILIWNIQSIRNYTKKIFLTQLLYDKDIHIALIQETFLIQDEKLYIKGYLIFRSDGTNHRKGVLVLISTALICDKYTIYKDKSGRFIKIKLKTQENKQITISNIYTEPDMKNHIEIIPEEILQADIIAGDLNNMETNLEKNGIYQTKSIGHLKEKVKQPKGTSDHYILI